jgi:hypothetical protein
MKYNRKRITRKRNKKKRMQKGGQQLQIPIFIISWNQYTYVKSMVEQLLKYPNMKIGIALMEQKLLAGIGNYLRCDILWYCKIHYERRIGTLTDKEKIDLYDASINIIKYHANLDYNLKYIPKNEFFVYQQSKDIFGNKVKRVEFNSRTIHYVDWDDDDDDDEIIIIKRR